ncbi:phosphonate C-P lyase system protein PhnH [Rhodococcus rhodnii]|uniref:Carbon-phosphorus lyase complex subunit n=2 Tax=Rhodococcus rhodnii TaxID=38312 RepID=R7WNG2_9NOCA|nr:phosphonate C-P lyase system protein PhnH [Rhodococcus rhodnii]EOM76842.1 hypothetical protein Rrhod_1755 [Rhodococcus rhodnii LMG 5362]
MTTTLAALGSGLEPTVAQQVYRAVLDAFSRPGLEVALPAAEHPAALLPVLALADLETPIHLVDDSGTWRDIVAVATGAPEIDPGGARFVTTLVPLIPELVAESAPGSAGAPEKGATLIALVPSLTGGTPLTLTGPGVNGTVDIAPDVDPDVWQAREQAATFPAGIDLLLVTDSGTAIGIPRTTRVARKEQ